jgi:acetyl esterase
MALGGDRLIDQELAAWVASLEPGPAAFDVAQARARGRSRALARIRGPELARVRDVAIMADGRSIDARVYEPAGAGPSVIVYLHGGMWLLCDLETHDRTCRRLADATRTRVVALDFRRGPEHRWPAAVEDGVSAVDWVRAEFDVRHPVLAGDSSGGHVALLVALRLRDGGGGCAGLLLACPNTDLRLSSPSVQRFGHGWGLDVDSLRWAVQQWLPHDVSPGDPAISPVLADLRGVPPSVIITADHDPLHDEGHALAQTLRDSGVTVLERCERGMVHGFIQNLDLISLGAQRAVDRWHDDACQLLNIITMDSTSQQCDRSGPRSSDL